MQHIKVKVTLEAHSITRHFTGELCAGDLGCCSFATPCIENEGDCNVDSDCFGPLVCGVDNCLKGRDGRGPIVDFHDFGAMDDCCTLPGL